MRPLSLLNCYQNLSNMIAWYINQPFESTFIISFGPNALPSSSCSITEVEMNTCSAQLFTPNSQGHKIRIYKCVTICVEVHHTRENLCLWLASEVKVPYLDYDCL